MFLNEAIVNVTCPLTYVHFNGRNLNPLLHFIAPKDINRWPFYVSQLSPMK